MNKINDLNINYKECERGPVIQKYRPTKKSRFRNALEAVLQINFAAELNAFI